MRTLTSADLVLLASFLILPSPSSYKRAAERCCKSVTGKAHTDSAEFGLETGNSVVLGLETCFSWTLASLLVVRPAQAVFAGTRICCSGFFGTSATYSRQQNFTTITFSYLLRIILHPSSKAQLPYPTGSMLFVRSWVSNLSQRSA